MGNFWTVLVLLSLTISGCGTIPGVDLAPEDGTGDATRETLPVVVWLPDVEFESSTLARLPLVEVYGSVGLGQCRPCTIEGQGHGCCGTDGWTAPVACGNGQGYLVDCRQMAGGDRGCGQDVVVGIRVCE